MSINEIYGFLVGLSLLSVGIEIWKYLAQGCLILKRRSARTTSRTYFFLATICLTVQVITLIVGYLCGYNNIFPVILLVPAIILNAWVFYLACRYKFKNRWFAFPKIVKLE